jgi:predicted ribonuclease YlaK
LDGRPLTYLLDTAIGEQQAELGRAVEALAQQIQRWSGPERFVVADTNFFIEYPDKLEDLDLSLVLSTRADPLHIVLPILVVDELDGLKRSNKSHVRWRAAYTLAVIDRILAGNKYGGELRAADWSRVDDGGGLPSGRVTLEVVLDPPGHVRLDRPDDELVERARVVQSLAGRPVTLITHDTGQATRVRFTELTLMKLPAPQLSDSTAAG